MRPQRHHYDRDRRRSNRRDPLLILGRSAHDATRHRRRRTHRPEGNGREPAGGDCVGSVKPARDDDWSSRRNVYRQRHRLGGRREQGPPERVQRLRLWEDSQDQVDQDRAGSCGCYHGTRAVVHSLALVHRRHHLHESDDCTRGHSEHGRAGAGDGQHELHRRRPHDRGVTLWLRGFRRGDARHGRFRPVL